MINEKEVSNLLLEKVGTHSSIFMFKAKVIFDKKIKTYCCLEYNGKKGCPNYGKKKGCPPNNRDIDEVLDVTEDIYVFGMSFNLKIHADEMKKKHPKWTQRQCYNVIYWQPKQRKKFKMFIDNFKKKYPELRVDTLPEGHGVDVTKMLKDAGVGISWDYPLDTVWTVAIAGKKAKYKRKKRVKNV